MTDAMNPGQLHIRLVRFLPRDVARALHPKAVDACLESAWANGWRDAEWLATYALEGTEHPGVRDAAAVFASRLRDICSQPCPTDETPTPPLRLVDPVPSGPPAAAETVSEAVSQMRKAIRR